MRYEQATGRMLEASGALIGRGYAGKAAGTNNPALQNVINVGPLPQGSYAINAPVDTATHGPFVMWLTPKPTNQMFGRTGFGIHGDSIEHPGLASDGCIVLKRPEREAVWNTGDRDLDVVSGIES
jgi:hypothetical protein